MTPAIRAFPDINAAEYFTRAKKDDPILSSSDFYLYASGRAALYFAVLSAGLPRKSRFLLPGFHCGVEVEAVKRAGHEIDFYNIRKDLSIDFKDLAKHITAETRALLIIHYFGLPQDMIKVLQFCREKALLLFEDCAHSLYSSFQGTLTGKFGDFGIYSLRKTIGLPTGGGLLRNTSQFPHPDAGIKYFDLNILRSTVRSVLNNRAQRTSAQGMLARGILSFYERSHNLRWQGTTEAAEHDTPWHNQMAKVDYDHAISGLSRPLLRKESFNSIVKQRRENYLMLAEKLKDIKKVWAIPAPMASDTCPLCYVVNVEKRDRLAAEMRHHGIHPFVFGATLHPSFARHRYPDIEFLSETLLGLPCHQQLKESEMLFIAKVFKELAVNKPSDS